MKPCNSSLQGTINVPTVSIFFVFAVYRPCCLNLKLSLHIVHNDVFADSNAFEHQASSDERQTAGFDGAFGPSKPSA